MKTVVVTVLTALVLAPAATAKEPLSATVCGSSGCKTYTDPELLREIPGGESTVALGRVAPFYRVTVVAGERGGESHAFSMYYVPSANAMAWAENGIVRLHPIYGPTANGIMRRLTRGIEPFAAPVLTSVRVGTRRVREADAQSYLALFSAGHEPTRTQTAPSDWVPIDFESARGSPWTDGTPDLVYSARDNLVERGWVRYELPSAVAEDVEAARALDAHSTRPVAWTVAFAALGALSLAALTRRRRSGEPRQPRAAEDPGGEK